MIGTQIGTSFGQDFSEGRSDLTREQQVELLRAVAKASFLGRDDVEAILDALRRPSQDGQLLASSFPAVVRIAEEYLQRVQVLFEKWKQMVYGDQPGAIQ